MAPPTSVLSKTLHSITLTKIRELEKLRKSYEDRKAAILSEVDNVDSDQHARIAKLLAGVRDLSPKSSKNPEVSNIEKWLEQSRYDTSISEAMLNSYEQELRSKLNVESRKMDLANLYSLLLTEWMNPPAGKNESAILDDDQSVVLETQKIRLQELCDKFESVVFTAKETDEVEIDRYLYTMFEKGGGLKSLEYIRNQLKSFSSNMTSDSAPFNTATLVWCIKGLLFEDLLSDEKQSILQDFLHNEVVLGEIADVLNMRFADIKNWNWDAGDDGIPVMPRQGLNGKYRIWMDEGKKSYPDICPVYFILTNFRCASSHIDPLHWHHVVRKAQGCS
jgi:hypothetical protein